VRKAQLEEELRLIQEVANAEITAIEPIDQISADDPESDKMQKRSEASADLVAQMEAVEASSGFTSDAFKSSAEDIGASLAMMAATGKASTSDMIKQALAESVAHLIKTIMATVPFPANIALAVGAGALAGKLSNAIPAFADGGVVPQGFPNDSYLARLTSGETILPAGEPLPTGGNMQLTTRVSGQDLLFLLNEATRRNNVNY